MKYKNILWIDDGYDGDSTQDEDFLEKEMAGIEERSSDIDKIKGYFLEHYNNVKWIKEYKNALDTLKYDNSQFDLVVFDINMEKGVGKEQFNEIKQILKEKRVDVTDEFKDFQEKAGMYLYLFLLNCGYPNERMILLTGNSTESPKQFLKEAHIHTGVDKDSEGLNDEMRYILEKEGGTMPQKYKSWMDELYKDEYYQIRRLVYKACEYWKEKLDDSRNKQFNEIAFNKIYFNKKKDIKLEKASFVNMLERTELLFPVIKPREPKALYYQAMQVVSMFHEESADIKKLKEDEENRCFHQSVRNFRNWSAHNKFCNNNMDAKIYALIFCLSLRSYFDGNLENQFIGMNDYEKEYFECAINPKIDYESFEKKYKAAWKRHFKKLQNLNIQGKNKKCWECENINELLVSSGLCKNEAGFEMKFTDAILNILDGWMVKKEKSKCENDEYMNKITYEWKEGYEKKEHNQEKYEEKLVLLLQDMPLKYYAYIIFSATND